MKKIGYLSSAGAVIILVTLYSLTMVPIRQSQLQMESQLLSLQSEIQSLQAKPPSEVIDQGQWKELIQSTPQKDSVQLLSEVHRILSVAGGTLQLYRQVGEPTTTAAPPKKQMLVPEKWQIRIRGTAVQAEGFLRQLSSSGQLISIKDISITTVLDQPGLVDMNLQLQSYFLNPSVQLPGVKTSP